MVVICNGAKDVNVVKHQSNGCVQEFSLFCQRSGDNQQIDDGRQREHAGEGAGDPGQGFPPPRPERPARR